MDTQKGAHGCATTQPPPPVPANSAAARHSDRSTGSNATTAYYASPSLCLSRLSIFPSSLFLYPSVHPSIRPFLLLFVVRLLPSFQASPFVSLSHPWPNPLPSISSFHHPTVIHMHVVHATSVSSLADQLSFLTKTSLWRVQGEEEEIGYW